jgi:hypothetical protein
LNYVYLANFAQPKADRQLYRLVKQHQVTRIFELGIEDLQRTWRLLRVAARYGNGSTVKYAALDQFDARDGGARPLSLIQAHRGLQSTAATVRLLPGTPTETLAGVANAHLGTDLLLVASWLDDQQMASAWAWMPRMLHEKSLVVRTVAHDQGDRHRMLTPSDVSRLAAATVTSRMAA